MSEPAVSAEEFLSASAEWGSAPVMLDMDVSTAICLVATIQLACRHPAFNGPTRGVAENLARELQGHLGKFSPKLDRGLEAGWWKAFDVPAHDSHEGGGAK